MSDRLHALINLLADGRFHSGEQLGKALGVSRAAIWKMLPRLEAMGIEVHAVSGKGYRLAHGFTPLERDAICAELDAGSLALLGKLELLVDTLSTNRYLLDAAMAGAPSGSVCFAEYQQGGRGRRGRQWHSPYGSNLYMSLLWRFGDGTARLGGLSLVVAIALMRCLNELGITGGGIKWPNDILVDGRKLAGILLDVAGESNGPCYVVIGVGLNYRMPDNAAAAIDQPWTDLLQCGLQHGRNRVAGRLLHHLLLVVREYQQEGLNAFRAEWERWDLVRDKEVLVHQGTEKLPGIARGIDESGLLLVEHQDGLRSHASGEVSLRAVAR